MARKFSLLLFAFGTTLVQAQKLKKDDKVLLANLQQHVAYLADDKLEGRRTGTPGEKLAAEYISNAFQALALQPRGSAGWYQPFEIWEGKEIASASHLFIDGNSLALQRDWFPMTGSPDTSFEALPSLALQEPGMPWFLDLSEMLVEQSNNPHFDLSSAIADKAREVKKKGASALFVYNTGAKADGLKFDPRDRSTRLPLPVVYIQKATAEKYFKDHSAALDLKVKTVVTEKRRSGSNVVGYIDNGAPTTVILGAHYDHLGYGEDNNSREVEKKGAIHNGADDNASGTAALIELARMLKGSKSKNNNYLFIAFSGEELGLYGSKYFTSNPSVDLSSVNYMINMDMVGRLNDSSRVVTVGGYGTSPSWGSFYNLGGKKKLYNTNLQFRYDSTGTGPSDHTSFYTKNIPVLFYFTGLHTDYHKPTDDHDKINYVGQLHLVKHIYSLVETADATKEKLAFTKTREVQTTTSARFSVSMGIMPDYTFSGAGVRVDGVSENRPAQKGGIRAGDVITALGTFKVNSVESYMQALGQFKKGDKTVVTYTRGTEALSTTVEF